jgi:NDP-sugar pyrophosphorylase family protein
MKKQEVLNIVVPMAGAGSRFSSAGYNVPKPLIKINGVEMIRLVINNLRPARPHRFIFICQKTHIQSYNLEHLLCSWAPGCSVIGINGLTEGAACTVLGAKDLINNRDALMIANSDQYIDFSIDSYLSCIDSGGLEGLIMTMKAVDPKWSFVGLDSQGLVTTVVEKQVISDEATVGIYNFKQGQDFISAAEAMIAKDLRVNNEFYVAPVYNELISTGGRVGVYNVGSEANGMYGLGTPTDLELFLKLPIHHSATNNV